MTDFVQVPADAAGKKINASVHNDGTNDISTQVFHLGDRNTPDQHQAVDNKGAAFVRFSDGSPDFDAFGRTTVSEPNLMGMYKFYQEDYDSQFMKTEVGGATVVHDAVLQGMKLTTGTANGDRASYRSNRFYHYRPGNTMGLTWTMKCGDTGTSGVVRRVGWITDDNGIYFEWDGTTQNIVVKNGNTGTEMKVGRASWNGDRLDGTGGDNNLSESTLDLSKNNIWWMDFQYLGSGAVRFGTYVDGDKIVCHTMGHYNELDRPYMSSASLAFAMEQENTSIQGTSHDLHVFCSVVTNDGYDEFDISPLAFGAEKTLTTTSFTPLISFRPTEVQHGVANRDRILPQMLSMLSDSGSVELKVEINPTLTGATWTGIAQGCEYDTAATAVAADGDKRFGGLVATGRSESIDLTPVFKVYKDGVTRLYDNTLSDHITISARLLTAGSSLTAIIVNALEVE